MKKTAIGMSILLFVVVSATFVIAQNNITWNYVWNGTEFVGMRGSSAGVLQLEIISRINDTFWKLVGLDLIYSEGNVLITGGGLNVSQGIHANGTAVCLEDGTNCPAGLIDTNETDRVNNAAGFACSGSDFVSSFGADLTPACTTPSGGSGARWGINETTLTNQSDGNLTVDIGFLKTLFPLLINIWDFDTNITDTNETKRFNNLTVFDCPAGQVAQGVHNNGTLACVIDIDTFFADTNASTACADGEYLDGSGNCFNFNNTIKGNLHDGLFVNYTLTKTTGNITSGTLGGYPAANIICGAEVVSGSHMCTMGELLNTINGNISNANFTATFRISEGAPGFTANANDCGGWSSDDGSALGSIWVGSTTHPNTYGTGSLVACNAERAIGCCI